MLPKKIQDFIESFSKIPSIGPRMAYRLAFYILSLDKETRKNIIKSFINLKDINRCPQCFFVKDADKKLCQICSDKRRNKKNVMIIEKEIEAISLEKSGAFRGIYLVLGESNSKGTLTPTQKKRLNYFKQNIRKTKEKLDEIIIAVNSNTKGDAIAEKIEKEINQISNKISKLGRGLPTGGEIEFADKETLNSALNSRN